MKKTLTVLLLFSALSLCGLSVVQWLREAELRDEIKSLTFQLQTETQLRIETQEKAAAFELEITRLTQLRADTEAKLLAVTEELTLTQTDQLQRGVSIALLSNEYAQARSRPNSPNNASPKPPPPSLIATKTSPAKTPLSPPPTIASKNSPLSATPPSKNSTPAPKPSTNWSPSTTSSSNRSLPEK